MTTLQIATQLVTYCRTGQFEKCYHELYHPNALSIEPEASPWPSANGLNAIFEKGRAWNAAVSEVHSSHVSEPIVGDQYFACHMTTDITYTDGNRVQLSEICLYQVKDGNIVKEQFFYSTET